MADADQQDMIRNNLEKMIDATKKNGLPEESVSELNQIVVEHMEIFRT